MDKERKLHEDVRRFLEVYKVLAPEGRAQFEAQMAGETKGMDDKTKKLYAALFAAAKDGCDIAQAIAKMKESTAA